MLEIWILELRFSYNSFEGDYQGPTKAIKVHPFTVNYRRMSASRYHMSATRTVETDSGLVEANWNGISTILSDELPNNFAVELTMKDFSWENRNGKGHYYKLLALRSLHL
jgi:hypothetical protein